MRKGLYSIDAGQPFLETLARGLLAQYGASPAELSAVRLFLPTRRACQAMADAFLRVADGQALLLPKMEPLGDLEPEDWHAAAFSAAGAIADLPPPIAPMRRQLVLSQMVRARDDTISPDQALKLAEALGAWLDQVQIHGLDPADLADLVPDEYAAHWGQTLKFLALVTEVWPSVLADEGTSDAVLRRHGVIEAQVAAWQADPPSTPVIAAGSTGSLPATAALMRAVLDLPQGAVVLPGLDRGLDAAAWDALPEGHPQFGLSQLLQSLDWQREAVADWAAAPDDRFDPPTQREQQARASLLSFALRPADAPALPEPPAGLKAALEHLTAVSAPGPEAEARVVALAMRDFLDQSVEGGEETAALVTADRGLARRVAAELERWGIQVDDSAGEPLLETAPGIFLRQVAEVARDGLPPVALLALLKHPFCTADPALVERLERGTLRGLRPAPGIEGLRQAAPKRDAEALAPLLEWIEAALGPLSALCEGSEPQTLADWLPAHVRAAEALATSDEQPGSDRLWADEAGEAAAMALDAILAAADGFPPLDAYDYPAVFDELLRSQTVRPRYGRHPRLAILGPLEARLHTPQLAILGGLNEGSWPPEPERDPWMGRPMRQAFGLPLPEWRIGLAAHDFAQAFAAPVVMLTRAERVGSAPTVPSRWLTRLDLAARAVTGELAAETASPLERGAATWLRWADALDQPDRVALPAAPLPRPPVAARFRDLSVTDVERWVRDPYGHYARHVLRLRALEPLAREADAGIRGEIIHDALRRFVQSLSPGEWPEGAEARLWAIGEDAFGPLLTSPGVQAFWWHRFERMMQWYVEHESQRWPGVAHAETEHKLSATLEAGPVTVTLSGRLDRLDRMATGAFAIIDYKTGTLPSVETQRRNWSPQLPLEGQLLLLGDDQAELGSLQAWSVGGGSGGKLGEAKDLTEKLEPVQVAEEAWAGLARLVAQFADPATPYLSEPRPGMAPRFSDYRHLARVSEVPSDG